MNERMMYLLLLLLMLLLLQSLLTPPLPLFLETQADYLIFSDTTDLDRERL